MITLIEVFDNDRKQYLMGIAYEIVSYDSMMDANLKKKGWLLPYKEADLVDIDAYASKYGIDKRIGHKNYWESNSSVQDYMTGDETYYYLYVKNLDGSSLSQSEKEEIDSLLEENNLDSAGISVNPVPFAVHY